MLTLEAATQAKQDFDTLEAANYVDYIQRVNPNGAGDIDSVILSLDGHVRYAPISASGMLLDGSPLRIWLREDDWQCRQQITKGHELGHYFLRDIADPSIQVSWGYPNTEFVYDDPAKNLAEAFCDYFAHRLICLPECLASGQ